MPFLRQACQFFTYPLRLVEAMALPASHPQLLRICYICRLCSAFCHMMLTCSGYFACSCLLCCGRHLMHVRPVILVRAS